MPLNVLKVATSFGGSMVFNNRDGIGRDMKTAGLSMAPAMEIMSWQERGAVYRTILDTDAIGRDKSNLLTVGEPEYLETFDGQIDCIAANYTGSDHLAEAGRRAIATAARRERHRARLMRLYLVGPSSDNRDQFFTSTLEAGYSARQALSAIFAQTPPQDAALLLSVGNGEASQAPGLAAGAARKRLSRLRARFSRLNLQAA